MVKRAYENVDTPSGSSTRSVEKINLKKNSFAVAKRRQRRRECLKKGAKSEDARGDGGCTGTFLSSVPASLSKRLDDLIPR